MKRTIVALLLAAFLPAAAQEGTTAARYLTLDDCHRLALQGNKALKSSEETMLAAKDMERMSVAEFFPRASVNGAYHWQHNNLQLLSDEQQRSLGNLGNEAMNQMIGNSSLGALLGSLFPGVSAAQWASLLSPLGSGLVGTLNAQGQSIVDALDMDFQHLCGGALTVTQPVYLGGKLRAMNKAARMAYGMAELNYTKSQQDKLAEVDKAYWQVVSVKHKKDLAQQYCRLLEHLDSNVQLMVAADVATQADATKVRVKLNEAQMALTKATGGYELAKMLLFQSIGVDMYGDYEVVEETALVQCPAPENVDMGEVVRNRDELRMLACADTLAQASVMLARSALLPNVVVTGSYLTSKPNFFNGYQDKFGGTLAVGVAVNIPLAHPGAFYGYRAAKHQAAAVHLQREEMEEKVQLQVNKLRSDLEVANRKYVQAQTNLLNAEENLALATQSFEAGVVSSTELMAAQTAWLQAKGEILDADIEMRMGRLYLDRAMGRKRSVL
ncbi:MAG: TolC family protein [Bacteroidales bacterium]|nr:TolC family protein [Bacteroidales bacterium]